jgi:hypothetical protein
MKLDRSTEGKGQDETFDDEQGDPEEVEGRS